MKRTMTKRFYASKSAIEYSPLLGTFAEAVADAKKKLSAGSFEEYYIVEVVAVVRKNTEPFTVEEIRK